MSGYSAAQCGLPKVFCNTSNTCSHDFLACSARYSSIANLNRCGCIKDFTNCLSSAGCLSDADSTTGSSPSSQVSVSQIQNWCVISCYYQSCRLGSNFQAFTGALTCSVPRWIVVSANPYATFQLRCLVFSFSSLYDLLRPRSKLIMNFVLMQSCDTAYSACHGTGNVTLVKQGAAAIQNAALAFAVTSPFSAQRSSGVVSNRGIYYGRYYWEATIQGRCAYDYCCHWLL